MIVLTVHVKPQSPRDEVVQMGELEYEVRTTATALKGKANKAMIKILAKHLRLSPSHLLIAKGERWNDKTVLVTEE
jgi:uncharacterized protein